MTLQNDVIIPTYGRDVDAFKDLWLDPYKDPAVPDPPYSHPTAYEAVRAKVRVTR